MLGFRFLKALYPLLKDIILDGKSIKEVVKNEKYKLLVLLVAMLSAFINIYAVPNLLVLYNRILVLENKLAQESKRTCSNDHNYNSLEYYRDRLDQLSD